MDWLKQILEENGVTNVSEILEAVGKQLPKSFVPKDVYNAKADEARRLKEQISNPEEKPGPSTAKDPSQKQDAPDGDLEERLRTLQAQYDADTKKLADEAHKARFDAAVELALAKSGARNPKTIAPLLDMEKVTFENGTLDGLSQQLEAIKAENGYLFSGGPSATGMRFEGAGQSMDGVEEKFFALNPNLKE